MFSVTKYNPCTLGNVWTVPIQNVNLKVHEKVPYSDDNVNGNMRVTQFSVFLYPFPENLYISLSLDPLIP